MNDTMLRQIHDAASHAYQALNAFSIHLFALLAIIQLVMVIVVNLIKQNGSMSMFTSIGKYIFILAFFDYFIMNMGTLTMQFLQGVIQLGEQASGTNSNFTPWSLVEMGAHWTGGIMSSVQGSGWFSNIGLTMLAIFYSFFILILMGLMAADLAVTYAKYYVLAALSGIFIALAPFEPTRSTALNIFRALLGLLLQLLTYYVLFSIFLELAKDWGAIFATYSKNIDDVGSIWLIPGQMIIFYLLAKNVPPFVAGLTSIGGFQNHGESAVNTAAIGAGLATKAVMSPVKGAGYTKEAVGAGISAGTIAAKGVGAAAMATPSTVIGAGKVAATVAGAGANAMTGGLAGGAIEGVKHGTGVALSGAGNTVKSVKEAGAASLKSLGDIIKNRNS